MRYQKSLEIEQRLNAALCLIQAGQYSTPMLADQLGVSIPTVSRIIAALRERGHDIHAEMSSQGWRYVIRLRPERRRVTHAARAGNVQTARRASKNA